MMVVQAHELRKVADAAKADEYRNQAKSYLRDDTHLAAALAGDDEAIAELVSQNHSWPEPGLGAAALAAYWGGTPRSAYRELLQVGWRTNWRIFKIGLGASYKRQVRRMIREAAFEHPFTAPVRIYRGASGESVSEACKGLSWTTELDVACWFAFRHYDPNGFVITAEVDASQVLYYDDCGWEGEIILEKDTVGLLDTTSGEWKARARRYAELHELECFQTVDNGRKAG
jgi:hypothetical protein